MVVRSARFIVRKEKKPKNSARPASSARDKKGKCKCGVTISMTGENVRSARFSVPKIVNEWGRRYGCELSGWAVSRSHVHCRGSGVTEASHRRSGVTRWSFVVHDLKKGQTDV